MKFILTISWVLLITGLVINLFYNEFWGAFLTASGIFMVLYSFKKIADSY